MKNAINKDEIDFTKLSKEDVVYLLYQISAWVSTKQMKANYPNVSEKIEYELENMSLIIHDLE